jgi:dCMP deaminase
MTGYSDNSGLEFLTNAGIEILNITEQELYNYT